MSALGKIEILGGGPGGLYTAILIRRLLPHVKVRVTEQNPEGATFGFGVVFSDRALDFLKADDPDTHDLILPHMERWQDMTLNLPDGRVTLDGVGFTAIGRLELIEILKDRVRDLGVEIRFDTVVESLDAFDADLVIGADGLNSLMMLDQVARGGVMTEAGPGRHGVGSNIYSYFWTPCGNRYELSGEMPRCVDRKAGPKMWTADQPTIFSSWGAPFPESFKTGS